MRFPLALTAKIAGHIIRHKIRKTPRFALVLQLEPLHTCNLTCTGCGRIREYSTSLKDMMPLEDCLGAAAECDAPMVSICGGEPLIYPHIEGLVHGLLAQRRIVYICTNATAMRKKMRDWLSAEAYKNRNGNGGERRTTRLFPEQLESKLQMLLAEELITAAQAEAIRQPASAPPGPTIHPSRWLYWNVHLDGLARTPDLIVERAGVFQEAV